MVKVVVTEKMVAFMIAKNIEIYKKLCQMSAQCFLIPPRLAKNFKIMSNLSIFHKDLPLLQILIHKDLPLMQILIHKDVPLIQILINKDFFSMFLFLIKDCLLISKETYCRWTAPLFLKNFVRFGYILVHFRTVLDNFPKKSKEKSL